jgi:hypothetical protein
VRVIWGQGSSASRQAVSAYVLQASTEFTDWPVAQSVKILPLASAAAVQAAEAALAARRRVIEGLEWPERNWGSDSKTKAPLLREGGLVRLCCSCFTEKLNFPPRLRVIDCSAEAHGSVPSRCTPKLRRHFLQCSFDH